MAYQDEETRPFEIYEVECHLTASQANDVWGSLADTVDGLRYHQIGMMLDKMHLDASDKGVREYAESLCCEHATLRVRLAAATRAKLASMGVVA